MKKKQSISLKFKWSAKTFFFLFVAATFFGIILVVGVFFQFSHGLSKMITVEDYRPLGVTRIYGINEKGPVVIGEFFKERRYLVPYEKIPDHVIKAFISAEDDKFFEHQGFNVLSMIRAGIANFKAGHVVQGGSTITQQVAKSLLLTPERSFSRKIRELILASRIEKNLTKQQILYLYLNQIYLGHGAYGLQAASWVYFKKDVSELSLAEASLLAGLPQAPSKYSPFLNPKRTKERQVYVLKRMLENRYINQNQFNYSSTQSLKIYQYEDINKKFSPYYVEHLRRYLVKKYGEKVVYEDGLSVYTALSVDLAHAASKSVQNGLLKIDKRIGYRGPIQHLENEHEIESFAIKNRMDLIHKKVPFQIFLSNGVMDIAEALRLLNIKSDKYLLDEGYLYQAVVVRSDIKKKTCQVRVGSTYGEISSEGMSWAKNTLRKGDVIWVSLLEGSSINNRSPFVFNLEQKPLIQGALFSMDIESGNVIAVVGGYDFEESEFDRSMQSYRQQGSAFKPIIYSSALEKGFTPASIIMDSPLIFRDSDGLNTWKPNNFEEKFYGDTTFRQAFIKSRNIPTVKLVQSIQVPYLIQYAKRLGMNSQFSQDLSISLGSASTSLIDLVKVYSLFPRLGKKVTPIFFTKIINRDGVVLEEALSQPSRSSLDKLFIPQVSSFPSVKSNVTFLSYPSFEDPDQVLDPRVAYVMTHLMKEVVDFGTGHAAKTLGRVAAGKTGTTNDSIDAWFVGFIPQAITGVWVGFDNQATIGHSETGARTALPIWLEFMKELIKVYPDKDFQVPDGVVFVDIDSKTGKLISKNKKGQNAIKEAFISGTEPLTAEASSEDETPSQDDFYQEDKE